MSEIRDIMGRYKEVRDRLRRPPNAVPDTGINLRRGREPPEVRETVPEPPVQLIVEAKAFEPFRRTDLTFSSTLEFAAKEFSITLKDIRSRRRHHTIARPRQIAIWIAIKNHIQTISWIGRYLGMHHTTIMHSRKAIDLLVAEDATMRQRIIDLETKILAAYPRTPIPTLRKPLLGGPAQPKDGNSGQNAIPKIFVVDKSG